MQVKFTRRTCAARDNDNVPVNTIGTVKQDGYPDFIWIGHNRVGPYTWASKGAPSKAVLVAFPQGDRWCWPSELQAA